MFVQRNVEMKIIGKYENQRTKEILWKRNKQMITNVEKTGKGIRKVVKKNAEKYSHLQLNTYKITSDLYLLFIFVFIFFLISLNANIRSKIKTKYCPVYG